MASSLSGIGTDPSGATIGGQGPNVDAGPSNTGTNTPADQIPTQNLPTTTQATTLNSPAFKATQGWYITGGIVVAIALANTKAGPFLLGILGVALLYQTNLLLQHK